MKEQTAQPVSLPPARILGIESSCDETAAAVVENGRRVLSSLVASQVDLHAQFGGVFPEVASRQHIKAIYPIVDGALQQAHMSLQDIDAIAVTRGPGLPGSLVVGMNAAKGLALGGSRPASITWKRTSTQPGSTRPSAMAGYRRRVINPNPSRSFPC
jgi:N6-L-threonylcarbamoyladenine synthase